MHLVEAPHEPEPELDAALRVLPPGTALVWSPGATAYDDCDVVEYLPPPPPIELVRPMNAPVKPEPPRDIAIDKLVECRLGNIRRTFDKVKLEQLTESAREHGILVALLVRPVEQGLFEILAGHRRFRAGKIAGLAALPCVVRELDDKAALELMLVELVQREDVHPLDEADGYLRLQREGIEADELAAKVGKSRAYIYTRLKLCALCEEGREAYYANKLSFGAALVVARVPPEVQQKALADVLDHGQYEAERDEGPEAPIPGRVALRVIRHDFMLELNDTPFDKTDAMLIPEAGACAKCPKRTGAQPELFSDVESKDICTDPGCFGRKRARAAELRVEKAKSSGERVLSKKESKEIFWDYKSHDNVRYDAPFVDLDARCEGDSKGRKWRHMLASKDVPIVVAQDPMGAVHELVDKRVASKALGRDTSAQDRRSTQIDAATRRQREKEKAHRAFMKSAIGELVQKCEAAQPKDEAEFWRVILDGILEGSWHDVLSHVAKRREFDVPKGKNVEQVVRMRSANSAPPALRALVLECVVSRTAYSPFGRKEDLLQRALRLFGVDAVKHRSAAVRGEEPGSPKKPAAKKPAAKKKAVRK